MTDKKISELATITQGEVSSGDLVAVVDSSESATKKFDFSGLTNYTDDVDDFFASSRSFPDDTIVGTRSEGFAYNAIPAATATSVANAVGQDFEVLPSTGGEFNAKAFKTGTDTAATQAAIDRANALGGGYVVVPNDMSPTWASLTRYDDVIVFDAASARVVLGRGPALETGSTASGQYSVIRPVEEGYGFAYTMPRGEGYHNEVFAATNKVFGRDYKAGVRLDGVADSVNVDYPVVVLYMQGREGVHGGRSGIASKVTKDFGPVHPDIHLSTGAENNLGALRVAFMEPTFVPDGPYTTGDKRVSLIKGAAWLPGLTVAQGDRVMVFGRVYEATEAGTTGTTPMIFDDTGGRQAYARNDGTTTVVGTSETVNGVPGYTGSDGSIKWFFIADTFFGANWTGWKQHVLIGDPNSEGIPGTDLFGQFTSDFGIQRTNTLEVIDETDGSHIARLNTGGSFISLEAGETQGASDNPRVYCGSGGVVLDQGSIVIGSPDTKTDGDTTYDLSGVARYLTFNDTTATDFTGFTNGSTRERITVLFNTGNTTLKHGTGLKIPGAADWTPPQFSVVEIFMVSSTEGWVQKTS